MVVRPELRVVVVTLEFVDLVLGFDVAVFGDANVDADGRRVDLFPGHARIGNGLVGAINADAAGARAAAAFLPALVANLVEIAHAGQRFADIANLVAAYAASAREQRIAKVVQIVTIGSRESHSGNHNPLRIGESGDHRNTSLNAREESSKLTLPLVVDKRRGPRRATFSAPRSVSPAAECSRLRPPNCR